MCFTVIFPESSLWQKIGIWRAETCLGRRKFSCTYRCMFNCLTSIEHEWKRLLLFPIKRACIYLWKFTVIKIHYFTSPLIILAIISYNLNLQNMTPWHWYTREITSLSLGITLFRVSWYKVACYFGKCVCCYFVERPHWFMLNNFSLHWYMTAIN